MPFSLSDYIQILTGLGTIITVYITISRLRKDRSEERHKDMREQIKQEMELMRTQEDVGQVKTDIKDTRAEVDRVSKVAHAAHSRMDAAKIPRLGKGGEE